MNLEQLRIPPVSHKFYERLVQAFPPLDPASITADTNIIHIQRILAQQEVINFISRAVRMDPNEVEIKEPTKTHSLWQRIKSIIK